MPVVPFAPHAQIKPTKPQVDNVFLMMAAAQMREDAKPKESKDVGSANL